MAWTTLSVKDAGGVTRNVVVWDDGTGNYTQAAALVAPSANILGHEKLVVSTTSVSLASIPTGATHAMITLEGADIRFREDGNAPVRDAADPTNDVGLLFISGNAAEMSNLTGLRFIRTGSSTADGRLNVSYRKYA
jgi:hypothetical protein